MIVKYWVVDSLFGFNLVGWDSISFVVHVLQNYMMRILGRGIPFGSPFLCLQKPIMLVNTILKLW